MKDNYDIKKTFEGMGSKWPSTVVARSQIGEFSGGILKPRTMANIDWKKNGPQMIRIGKNVMYPVDSLIEWLIERANEGSWEPIIPTEPIPKRKRLKTIK